MDAGVTRPRFVGRAEELARLDSAFAHARDGHPRVVFVAGEAGVGKSRLVDEALASWRAAGAIVLEGACVQPDPGGPPFAPVVGILRSLRRTVEPGALAAVLGPGRGVLGRLVPDLLERSSDIAPDVADGSSQVRLFELVAGSLERLARRAPIVVTVEDVHWADPSSRELLDFLVRGLPSGERLLLVATVRTDAPDAGERVRAWAAELVRLPLVERLDLGPLPRADVTSLLAEVLRRAPDPAFVDRVMERANGNPFLVEELGAVGDDPEAPLPEHLREILLARLGPLDPHAREILRAAAAGGRRVDDRLLAGVLAADLAAVDAALRDALDRGILVSDPGTRDLRFRHPLLRDAVEAELFPGERERIHLAYAMGLEQQAARGAVVAPEALAFHWDAAGRPDRAVPAHVQAARGAAAVYAWAEASRAFDRAIELLVVPDVLSADELAEVLLEAGNAWGLQGAYERAVSLTRRAVGLVDPERDPARAAHAHERLRWCLWEAGDIGGAGVEVEEALRLAPAAPPSALRAEALVDAAVLALWRGDPSTSLRLAGEATEMARHVHSPAQEGLGLGASGLALAALGDVDAAAGRLREAMTLARRLDAAEGLALGYTNLTAILDRAGRTADALETAEAGFAEVERYGLARTFGVPLLAAAARMRFHQGRWTEAEALLEQARSLVPLPAALATVELQTARLDAARGRFGEAEAALEAAATARRGARSAPAPIGLGIAAGLSPGRGPVLHARIELAAWRGDLGATRAIEDEALALPFAAPLPDPSLAWVAATALRMEADAAVAASLGRDEASRSAALHRIESIGGWLEAGLGALGGDLERASATDPRVGVLAAQCLAERDRAGGRSDPAAWDAVARGWSSLGRPLPVAYARFREGEASLGSAGGREPARAALGAAARIAAEIGAAPLLVTVERLARMARIDLTPAETPRPARDEAARPIEVDPEQDTTVAALGLTPRERQVLRLVAEGWSNPEIGEALGISPRTASVHVSNVLAKLGVPNRVEAAVAAMRLGLVPSASASREAEAEAQDLPEPDVRAGSDAARQRTFLFTDIVGSTPLVQAIGDSAWSDLLRWHDTTLRAEFDRYGGSEVDHAGDGFFVVFRLPRHAIECAIDIQRTLAAHRASSGFAPTLRIGAHEGEAIETDGGYVGAAVHIASRIGAHAEGGTILVSATTIRAAGMRGEGPLVKVRLPGVAEPVAIARVPW